MQTFKDVQRLLNADMEAVNTLILEKLYSDVTLVNQIGHYIIEGGGKRIRPMLVLLTARALGYRGERHINLAAVVEFIHTATLLHDDVVDDSSLRRGRDTANIRFGNAASVLVGDFLYSRAFQMMVDSDSMQVMSILSDATNIIAEGEVLQLMNCNDPDTTEAAYMEVIRYKTAKLFEAATELGAVLANTNPTTKQAVAQYGMHLGTAFQIIDDVIDYDASSEESGKNLGDDLAEGKPTLPLIQAMKACNANDRTLIRHAIENGGLNDIDKLIDLINSSGALEYSYETAKNEAQLAVSAIDALPESDEKAALILLCNLAVNRRN